MSSSWLRRSALRMVAVAAWAGTQLAGNRERSLLARGVDRIGQFARAIETGEFGFELLVTWILTATMIYLLVATP